jgi:hypothetical protein
METVSGGAFSSITRTNRESINNTGSRGLYVFVAELTKKYYYSRLVHALFLSNNNNVERQDSIT